MAETYKIVYFNLRALAEPTRYLFGYLGIPYEETLIDPATWQDVKKDFKWQHLPELHIEGPNGTKMLSQSNVISRYLCRKYKPELLPSDPMLLARSEEIIDALHDFRMHQLKPYFMSKLFLKDGKDEEIKKELMANQIPLFLNNVNEILLEIRKDHGETGDYFLGKDLSWADFWLPHILSGWGEILGEPELLKPYQALQKQHDAFMAIPQIKERNDTRPKTRY